MSLHKVVQFDYFYHFKDNRKHKAMKKRCMQEVNYDCNITSGWIITLKNNVESEPLYPQLVTTEEALHQAADPAHVG